MGDDAGVARALEPLATIHWLTGNASAMLDASERALRLAVEAGERRVVTAAVSYVGRALVLGTTPCTQGLQRLEELAAELEDDATAQSAARLEIATLLSMLGRFDEARAHTAIARETFQELGQRRRLAGAEEISGLIAWDEGRLEDAARDIRAGYAFFRGQDDAANATPTAADLAQVLCELGRYEEAADLADEVRAQAGTYDLEPQIGWRCVRARVLSNAGEHDRAEELVRSAFALVEPTEFLSLQADVLVDLSSVLAESGRVEEATSSLEDALDRRRTEGRPGGRRSRRGAPARAAFRLGVGLRIGSDRRASRPSGPSNCARSRSPTRGPSRRPAPPRAWRHPVGAGCRSLRPPSTRPRTWSAAPGCAPRAPSRRHPPWSASP